MAAAMATIHPDCPAWDSHVDNYEPQRSPRFKPFALGQLVTTPGAMELLSQPGTNWISLIRRHRSGDWGDLTGDDKRCNDLATHEGDRILSAYDLPRGLGRVWIITEADRSATTILLPEEYWSQNYRRKKYGYKAFYGGREIEIYAATLYAAKLEAIRFFCVKKGKEHLVTVILCERADGSEVTHIPDF